MIIKARRNKWACEDESRHARPPHVLSMYEIPCTAPQGCIKRLDLHVDGLVSKLQQDLSLHIQCEQIGFSEVLNRLHPETKQLLRVLAGSRAGDAATLFPKRVASFHCGGESHKVTAISSHHKVEKCVSLQTAHHSKSIKIHTNESFVPHTGALTAALGLQNLEMPVFKAASCVFCGGLLGVAHEPHVCSFWALGQARVSTEHGAFKSVLLHVQDSILDSGMPSLLICVVTPLGMMLAVLSIVDLVVYILAPQLKGVPFTSPFEIPECMGMPVSVCSLENVVKHYMPLFSATPQSYQMRIYDVLLAFGVSVAQRGGVNGEQSSVRIPYFDTPPPISVFRVDLKMTYKTRARDSHFEGFVSCLQAGRLALHARIRQGIEPTWRHTLECWMSERYDTSDKVLDPFIKNGLRKYNSDEVYEPRDRNDVSQGLITDFYESSMRMILRRAELDNDSRQRAFFSLLQAVHTRFREAQRRFFSKTLRMSDNDIALCPEETLIVYHIRFLTELCECNWTALSPIFVCTGISYQEAFIV